MLFGEASLAAWLGLNHMLASAVVAPQAMHAVAADLLWLREAARDPRATQSHCLCSAERLLATD